MSRHSTLIIMTTGKQIQGIWESSENGKSDCANKNEIVTTIM